MKESFGTKLKKARTQSSLKQSELAKQLGVKNTTISNWENDISKPDLEMLSYICGILNVKASFFLEAQPPVNDINSSEFEIIQKYRSLDPYGRETIDIALNRESARVTALTEKDARIAELEAGPGPATIIEMPTRIAGDGHLIAYFRDASAGGGIFILGNEPADKIAVSESDWDERADYVIRVNGGSMLPDYGDGDNVMVSQHMELHYGDVGIFVVNGKAYIKEYGETELVSRNPEFPNIPIREFDNIVCVGKVIGKLEGEGDYEIISN